MKRISLKNLSETLSNKEMKLITGGGSMYFECRTGAGAYKSGVIDGTCAEAMARCNEDDAVYCKAMDYTI